MVKNPPANAGDVDSIPGSGKIPWRREWQPTPVFLPGNSHGVQGVAKSQTRLWLSTHTHTQRGHSAALLWQKELRVHGQKTWAPVPCSVCMKLGQCVVPWSASFLCNIKQTAIITISQGAVNMKSDDRIQVKGTSLVVQWLRIHLLMQETWVWSLVQEDSTCRGATKPMHQNCSGLCSGAHVPQLRSPRPRACAPNYCSEKPCTTPREQPLIAAARESPHPATKTWNSQL